MSETMKSVPMRFDKDLYDILTKKAQQRGIKLSRYIRMLIERGLVIDHQLHQLNGKPQNDLISNQNLLPIIAELVAESTMMARYLYREHFSNDDDFKEKANVIYAQSQELLEKMIKTKMSKA